MKAALQKETRSATPERAESVQYIVPDVNIYETKDGYELEAEMPGVNKDGLEVTLEGNEITITGHRTNEVVTGEVLFRERNHANYRRVFDLDPAIDTARISARMNQGVLLLFLPKSEAVKPRKIVVSE
ncbi:MAG TPA: Hsp20/alpha crystallin family protein [Verrucomicrobiae bacterium]|nr:Hsp20/alpha crystallin family protein [Verrucomicrobiae bacterium]